MIQTLNIPTKPSIALIQCVWNLTFDHCEQCEWQRLLPNSQAWEWQRLVLISLFWEWKVYYWSLVFCYKPQFWGWFHVFVFFLDFHLSMYIIAFRLYDLSGLYRISRKLCFFIIGHWVSTRVRKFYELGCLILFMGNLYCLVLHSSFLSVGCWISVKIWRIFHRLWVFWNFDYLTSVITYQVSSRMLLHYSSLLRLRIIECVLTLDCCVSGIVLLAWIRNLSIQC